MVDKPRPPKRKRLKWGVLSVLFAAGIVAVTIWRVESLNPWGLTAAALFCAALTISAGDYLSDGVPEAWRRLMGWLFMAGLVVLVGWSQARPQDLTSRRLSQPGDVKTAGLVLGTVLVLLGVGWLVRRLGRRR